MVANLKRSFPPVAAWSRSVRVIALGLATSIVGFLGCSSDSPHPSDSTGARAGTGTTLTAAGASGAGNASGDNGPAGGAEHRGGASSLGGAGSTAAGRGGATHGVGGATGAAGHASSTGGADSTAGTSAGSPGSAGSAGTAGAGEGGAEARPDEALALLERARAEYRGWVTRSDAPEAISSEIFQLCRLPTPIEQGFVASEHGDDLYLLDWLNPSAEAGFADHGSAPFATGAAIVKEKLVRTVEGTYELHALGLMIKRDAGFDPAHGDWQFGYWNAADGMGAGAEENTHCGDCHAGAATDFVFMDNQWHLEQSTQGS
jgi:hypothetical protein